MSWMWMMQTMVLGQADAAAASVEIQSVWDFVVKGGPMMIPIGLCSLVALAVIAERFISLRRTRIVPPGFWPGLEKILNHGSGSQAQALAHCNKHPSPIARLMAVGIRKLDHPPAAIEKAVAEAGQREVIKLRKFVRALAVIASVSPLMGLLGTIFGMIKAFQTVAGSAEALGKTELLATGIYQAMITTAAGLLVAIPVLMAYHWVLARIERRTHEMDDVATRFIDLVSSPSRGPALRMTGDGDDAVKPAAAAV